MKKLLAISALSIASIASAQITLDASRMPQPGEDYTTVRVDTTGVTEGNAGANVTWNFAGLNLLQQQTELRYVNASSTPYMAEFPNATLASLVNDAHPIYSYMRNTGNQLISYGSRSDDFVIVYSDPQVMMQFPFTYHSTFSDVYGGVMTIDTSMQVRSGGEVSAVGDAYGTIVLPGGQSRSSLRVKLTRVHRDTMEVPSFPPMISTTTLTSYEWFVAGTKFPILVVSYSRSEGFLGTTEFKFIEYHMPAATDVKRTDSTIPAKMSLDQNFPNPFNPSTNISFSLSKSGRASLRVYNLIGQEVAGNVTNAIKTIKQ
jgi:hypothetical protein